MNVRKNSFSRFYSDLVLLLACSVFFMSVIEPFMVSGFVSPSSSKTPQSNSISYWSYRNYLCDSNGLKVAKSFNDYWFGSGYWDSDIFIVTFLLQSATLLIGLLSFFPNKRKLAAASSILSLVTALPMILAYNLFSIKWSGFYTSFGPGYWLIYPSAVMFLLSLILGYAATNESERKRTLKSMKVYWKHHIPDIVFVIAGSLSTLYVASQVALVLSDASFHDFVLHGELPRGATIVPFYDPWNTFHPEPVIIPPEGMSAWNWFGLFSPLVIPFAIIVLECARYYLWRRQGRTHREMRENPEKFASITGSVG